MLTPHCSAASGMVASPSIASTTRLRKSSEYGFAIHAGLLPVGSLNHIRARMGIPDSAFSGNALARRRAPSTLKQYDEDGSAGSISLISVFRSHSGCDELVATLAIDAHSFATAPIGKVSGSM